MQEFPLQFELQPISYGNDLETKVLSSSSNSLNIGGNISISPTIIVNGIGTFSINNKSVEVSESGITIDCDLMNCTKNNLNVNNKVILNEFPTLNPNNNTISIGSGINSITLKYRKGWL